MMEIEEKYHACNLCSALCRNINDNFKSISFQIIEENNLQIKIVLTSLTKRENDYIEDFIAEFEALQERGDFVLNPIIEVGASSPLKNLVYQKCE